MKKLYHTDESTSQILGEVDYKPFEVMAACRPLAFWPRGSVRNGTSLGRHDMTSP